jgi:hypothetical protein
MLSARKIGCAALLGVMLLSGCIANRQANADSEAETNHAAIPDNQQHVAESNHAALPENPQQVVESSNIDNITVYLENFHAQQLQDELKIMERIKGTWIVEEWAIMPYVGAYHPEPERAILGKVLIIDDDYGIIFDDHAFEFLQAEVIQPSYMNRIYSCNYDTVTLLLGLNTLCFHVRIKFGTPEDASLLLLQPKEGELYIYCGDWFERPGVYSLKKMDPAKGN